jgi:hypothetical protein
VKYICIYTYITQCNTYYAVLYCVCTYTYYTAQLEPCDNGSIMLTDDMAQPPTIGSNPSRFELLLMRMRLVRLSSKKETRREGRGRRCAGRRRGLGNSGEGGPREGGSPRDHTRTRGCVRRTAHGLYAPRALDKSEALDLSKSASATPLMPIR